MAASWQRLGDAVGCTGIGVNRVRIDPGRLSTPPHSHGASEEIVFVLGGSGFSWQDEQVYELRPGDCVVHLADHEEHTLRGGPDGLEVLICGTRHPTEIGWLPRSRAIRIGWPWVEGRTDDPWDVEAAAEPLEFGEPAPRPANIVNVDDATVDCGEGVRLRWSSFAISAARPGSVQTGMRLEEVADGKLNCPPHCHGSEEEFFLVLDGEGTCLLGRRRVPDPARDRSSAARRERVSHTRSAGRSRSSRTARESRTTSATTRARTRSASGASASSPASRASTTGTASRPA